MRSFTTTVRFGGRIEAGELAIARSFHRTEIIRIDIESVSGKAKASLRHINYAAPKPV